jgi:hypothetical protein
MIAMPVLHRWQSSDHTDDACSARRRARASSITDKEYAMEPEDKGRQSRWQAKQGQSEDLPNFSDDLGPARSPLQELRDNPFLTPEGDDTDDDLYAAPAEPPRERRPSGRARRTEQQETVLTGTTLLAVIAYFAIGGIALIITGLVLSGFAGILMALVGLLSAAAAGVAGWQQFAGQRRS